MKQKLFSFYFSHPFYNFTVVSLNLIQSMSSFSALLSSHDSHRRRKKKRRRLAQKETRGSGTERTGQVGAAVGLHLDVSFVPDNNALKKIAPAAAQQRRRPRRLRRLLRQGSCGSVAAGKHFEHFRVFRMFFNSFTFCWTLSEVLGCFGSIFIRGAIFIIDPLSGIPCSRLANKSS